MADDIVPATPPVEPNQLKELCDRHGIELPSPYTRNFAMLLLSMNYSTLQVALALRADKAAREAFSLGRIVRH